jgi:hypothetical protein
MSQKKSQAAFFPLGIFLFPGEESFLHIFEERYKQLIEEIVQTGEQFVIPFVLDNEMTDLGNKVFLKRVLRRYPGGESDIKIECSDLVHIHEYVLTADGKSFPGGEYSKYLWEDALATEELFLSFEALRNSGISLKFPVMSEGGLKLSQIAQTVLTDASDKYAFAKMNIERKTSYLHYHIKQLMSLLKQEERTFHNLYLN